MAQWDSPIMTALLYSLNRGSPAHAGIDRSPGGSPAHAGIDRMASLSTGVPPPTRG